jgi:peroxiredoxin
VTPELRTELQQTRMATGESLWDASFRRPLLVVFIRHLGCTFCREALADLKAQSEQIMAAGVEPVVVHMTQPEDVQPLLERYGLQHTTVISDPDRKLFRAFELPLGKWWQLFGPKVIWRAVADGVVFRHGFGWIQGDAAQLTGAFLVHRGEVIRAYRNRTTADRPNYADLACPMNPQ